MFVWSMMIVINYVFWTTTCEFYNLSNWQVGRGWVRKSNPNEKLELVGVNYMQIWWYGITLTCLCGELIQFDNLTFEYYQKVINYWLFFDSQEKCLLLKKWSCLSFRWASTRSVLPLPLSFFVVILNNLFCFFWCSCTDITVDFWIIISVEKPFTPFFLAGNLGP